jgi:hypothetical protein
MTMFHFTRRTCISSLVAGTVLGFVVVMPLGAIPAGHSHTILNGSGFYTHWNLVDWSAVGPSEWWNTLGKTGGLPPLSATFDEVYAYTTAYDKYLCGAWEVAGSAWAVDYNDNLVEIRSPNLDPVGGDCLKYRNDTFHIWEDLGNQQYTSHTHSF